MCNFSQFNKNGGIMEGSNEQNQVELTKRGRKRKIGKGDKVDDFSFRATRSVNVPPMSMATRYFVNC